MSKEHLVYQNALAMLDDAMALGDTMQDMGLRWEFGEGQFGKFMDDTVNRCEEMILVVFGLELDEIDLPPITGIPMKAAIYNGGSKEFSLLADEFAKLLFYKEEDKEEVRDYFWIVFGERKSGPIPELIKKGFKIGIE